MAVLTLPSDITKTGINQDSLVDLLTNFVTVINELVDDHATFQLAVDGITQKLDGDAGITDTNYEAVHGVGGSGAALPATLTNSTNLTLLGG